MCSWQRRFRWCRARHTKKARESRRGDPFLALGQPLPDRSHLLRALETFRAQGIEFVSFSEQLDTSTPAGKMVFTVLGAVAELERGLIVERVKAGLPNARAKGKVLGRPKRILDTKRITALRAQGVGWKRIAADMGVGVGTFYQIALEGSKIRERVF
jgi:DNA invertase Pin-like site-specific DNA recombinase